MLTKLQIPGPQSRSCRGMVLEPHAFFTGDIYDPTNLGDMALAQLIFHIMLYYGLGEFSQNLLGLPLRTETCFCRHLLSYE